jgi:hypothetical protein
MLSPALRLPVDAFRSFANAPPFRRFRKTERASAYYVPGFAPPMHMIKLTEAREITPYR